MSRRRHGRGPKRWVSCRMPAAAGTANDGSTSRDTPSPRPPTCREPPRSALPRPRPRHARRPRRRRAGPPGAEGAKRALAAAESQAARGKLSVCIVVVDTGGETLAALRLDGVLPAFCDVARAKARTAARYGRPSRAWSELLGRGNAGALMNLP